MITAVALLCACGDDGGPAQPAAGTGGDTATSGAGATDAGGAAGTAGSTGAQADSPTDRWNDLPGGDGEQAASHQSTCERQCQNDGACDIRDATRCADNCDDPRRLCQADMFAASCWTKILAWRDCVYALDCEQLDHYYYRASTPDRPCMAEIEDFSADCPDSNSAFYTECWGEDLECPTGRDQPGVPAFWICDGDRDCTDGSDEELDLCTWRVE